MEESREEANLRRRLQEFFDGRYVLKIEFIPTKLIAYGSVGLLAAGVVTLIFAVLTKSLSL